jgi:hypothetical protein
MIGRLVLTALAFLAFGIATEATAQRGGGDKWVLLGTREVDLGKGTDTVDLSKAKGRVKALRLEVDDAPILLSRVQVIYNNGTLHNEDRKINLLVGERTRPIDLRNEERFVDQINLVFERNTSAKERASVEVWGLQSSAGAVAVRSAPSVAPPPSPSAPPRVAAPAQPAAPATPSASNLTGPASTPTKTDARPGDVTAAGVLFGSQRVGFGIDRDKINVGGEIGKFDRVRLRVLDNDVHFNEIKVIYGSGDPDTLAVNEDIRQNTFTKWLPLKGDRFIREIQLSYRSKPNFRGQATVEVYGDYAPGWLGPNGEGRKYNQGWVLLGAQTAGFVGFDKDIIPVGKNEGGFKRIRVTVRDRAITLNEVRVIYGSGQEDIIPVKARVDAGSTYGPIDLKGGTRIINQIEARYRSRLIDASAKGKGRAVVEVWGQH